MKQLFLISLLIPNLCFGVCDKPVTYLLESKPAPCTGFLFTPQQEEDVRFKIIKYDELIKLTEKQDEMINLLSNRLDITQQRLTFTEKNLEYNQTRLKYDTIIYFCLGAILGVAASKIVK